MLNKKPYILTFIYMTVAMLFPFLIWISEKVELPAYIYSNKYYICKFAVFIISAFYYLLRIYKLKRIKVTDVNIWINITVIVVLYFYYGMTVKFLHLKVIIADFNILNYILAVHLFMLLSDIFLCVSCKHNGDEKYNKYPNHKIMDTDNKSKKISVGFYISSYKKFKIYTDKVSTSKYFKILSYLNLIIALFFLNCIYPIPSMIF